MVITFLKKLSSGVKFAVFVRVLERVVLTQLMTHLETRNLLEPFQSAYRKCHGTDHVILSQQLSSTFGCTGTVLGWFESYLSNRTQSVVVNDVQSAPSSLKYGVPQGSVLGPILFTMYTQPLGSVIQELGTTYQFFADNSQLYDLAAPSEFCLSWLET